MAGNPRARSPRGARTGRTPIFVLRLLWSIRRFAVTVVVYAAMAAVCAGALYLWFAGAPELFEPVVEEVPYDYLPDARRLLEEERYAELFSVGRFVAENPDLPHHDEIQALCTQVESEYYGWFSRARRFTGGFVTGDTASTESMVGTVISDFLVVGDVRDLGIEGYHAATGQEVDYFVASLSGIGFLATAATFFPEPGSTASGVSGQVVLSTLKGLKRMKALSPRMVDEVGRLARRAADTRSLRPMAACMENTASVARHAPAGAVPVVMRQADSVDDVRRLADWLRAAPDETIVALARGGDAPLKGALKAAPSKAMLSSALRSTTRVVKPTVRGTKFIFRGRPAVVMQRLAEEAAREPLLRHGFLAAGVLLGVLVARKALLVGARLAWAGARG